MPEHIYPDDLHGDVVLWDFTHGSINLFLKLVYEFGVYILTADKPAWVFYIP